MLLPQLDPRLQAALELIGSCHTAADIGADHGLLSLHMLHSGAAQKMIVCDISAIALRGAQRLLTQWELMDRVEFYVADGLSCLAEKMDAIAILGMGGDTLIHILKAGAMALQGAPLIISPQTNLMETRQFLSAIGYSIEDERLVRAGRRLYIVMRAMPGHAPITEKQALLGPYLLQSHPPLFHDYLAWRHDVLSGHLAAANIAGEKERAAALTRYLTYIQEELL